MKKELHEASETLLRESGCTVRKYRDNLSGVAFTRAEDWGIEAPWPSTPLRFSIFAHEVGHQMLHREKNGKQRWQEELEAWAYSFRQMRRFGIPLEDKVVERANRSIERALKKAHRAGSKTAPPPFASVIKELLEEWTASF